MMIEQKPTPTVETNLKPRRPSKMTVAAALRRIKKLKGEIAELTARATSSASFPELRPPPFKYFEAEDLRRQKILEMLDLQEAVAISNASTKVTFAEDEVMSVPRVIRVLDEVKAEIAFLRDLPIHDRTRDFEQRREQIWDDALNKTVTRLVEVVTISVMTPEERARRVDMLQARFELLNVALEARNHDVYIEV